MNKAELIEAMSGRLGDRKSATAALDAVLNEIQNAVTMGDKVSIAGFGVFEKRVRAAQYRAQPARWCGSQGQEDRGSGVPPGCELQGPRRRGRSPRRPRRRRGTAAAAPARKTATVAAPARKTAIVAAPARKTATVAAPAKKIAAPPGPLPETRCPRS